MLAWQMKPDTGIPNNLQCVNMILHLNVCALFSWQTQQRLDALITDSIEKIAQSKGLQILMCASQDCGASVGVEPTHPAAIYCMCTAMRELTYSMLANRGPCNPFFKKNNLDIVYKFFHAYLVNHKKIKNSLN